MEVWGVAVMLDTCSNSIMSQKDSCNGIYCNTQGKSTHDPWKKKGGNANIFARCCDLTHCYVCVHNSLVAIKCNRLHRVLQIMIIMKLISSFVVVIEPIAICFAWSYLPKSPYTLMSYQTKGKCLGNCIVFLSEWLNYQVLQCTGLVWQVSQVHWP